MSYQIVVYTLYARDTVFPAHIVISRHGKLSVATCLRCGFHAGARNLALLEQTVQLHSCGDEYRGAERRAFPRWPVSLQARCYARIANARCVINDMSESGMGVKSPLRCNAGDEVTAAWRFARYDKAFRVRSTVRRVANDILGIEFMDISVPDRQLIARFLNNQTLR